MQVLQPTLFGCVGYGEGLKAKPGKLAPPELWLVEPALDLAGWKPALLDGGTDAFLPVLGAQESVKHLGGLCARLCRPEAYTTTASKGHFSRATGTQVLQSTFSAVSV